MTEMRLRNRVGVALILTNMVVIIATFVLFFWMASCTTR
jgi:hypothetical protein